MNHSQQFKFKYEGADYIDLSTLLTSQFHFMAAVNALQKELHPEIDLKIKVGAAEKGSFIIDLLFEGSWTESLLDSDRMMFGFEILGAFADMISIRKLLKGKSAKSIEEDDEKIIVHGENNSVTVQKTVFNIYQQNATVNQAIEQTFDNLKGAEGVTGVKVYDSTKKPSSEKVVVDVAKDEFSDVSRRNEYLDKDERETIINGEVLFIKKPDLMPNRGRLWKWEFIHKGRDIKADIVDKQFETKINDGFRVGQGDRLVADIKVYYQFSKQFDTWIEKGKYEVVKVHKVISREDQARMDM